jgi:hypothetical protein
VREEPGNSRRVPGGGVRCENCNQVASRLHISFDSAGKASETCDNCGAPGSLSSACSPDLKIWTAEQAYGKKKAGSDEFRQDLETELMAGA